MTNSDLIDYAFKNSNVPKKDCAIVLDKVIEGLQKSLRQGGGVSVSGLGIFRINRAVATTKVHPLTGLIVQVPAKKKIQFKVAKPLLDFVN